MKILNKNTNELMIVDFDFTLEHCISRGLNFNNWEVVADDYEANSQKLIEAINTSNETFYNAIEQTKTYNEKEFKVKWCLRYESFLGYYKNDAETLDIWDASEISCLTLNKAELTELKELLTTDYETAFQVKKLAIKEAIELYS